jgi:hypothetical protein
MEGGFMRKAFLYSALVGLASLAYVTATHGQTKPSAGSAQGAKQTSIPDLSGNWLGSPATFSISDPSGKKTGTAEDDTPYRPETLAKLKLERPEAGPRGTFDTDDPRIVYCDPIGIPRIYVVPNLFKFVQTPDDVYMIFEYNTLGRQIRLNGSHPKDPDPTWWGDSVGHYEGDTLVIDTVGFNDKTWLDHVGRPHSDQLHLIERFHRIDHNNLQLDLTIDDPGAYTKTWYGRKIFKLTQRDFVEHSCSMSENEHFKQSIIDPTLSKPK